MGEVRSGKGWVKSGGVNTVGGGGGAKVSSRRISKIWWAGQGVGREGRGVGEGGRGEVGLLYRF